MSTTVTLPFGGCEMSSFDPSDTNSIEVTSAGTFDSSFARCSIQCLGSVTYCDSPKWTAAGTFWFHGNVFFNQVLSFTATYTGDTLYFKQTGTTVFKAVVDRIGITTGTLTFYTLQSGVLTSIGSININLGVMQRYDVRLVAGGSGSCTIYSTGTQVLQVTGLNHAGFTGVDQIELRGHGDAGASNVSCWSEIICDTVPHIGDSLKTYPIDTASATNTGYTGPVSNIDEIAYSDATFVYATTNGQISTYYASGFSLGTYTVVSVLVAARTRCGASGPQNQQMAVRVGGSNYTSSSIALGLSYQACTHAWTTNPNTSAVWTASQAAGIEGGMEAIT